MKTGKLCARCPLRLLPAILGGRRWRKVEGQLEGCPAWLDPDDGHAFVEQNVATGEQRLLEGCYFDLAPKMMQHVVAASSRPAAAFESARNTLVRALSGERKMDVAQALAVLSTATLGGLRLQQMEHGAQATLPPDPDEPAR